MSNLTSVARLTRKAVIILIFASFAGVFLFILLSSVKRKVDSLKKAPAPVISTTFGPIPKVKFPAQQFPQDIKFSVETLSGRIPEASPTAKVYFLPKKQQGLLTNIRVNQDAKKLGFNINPQTINKKLVYKEPLKELTIDPITRNFSYKYNYLSDGSVFEGDTKLTKALAISQAQTFLNSISALPNDYNAQTAQSTFLTFNGAEFIPTFDDKDNINATSVRVDFFRNSVDNYPVVTPNFNQGNIYVIISKSSDKSKQIIKAEKNYFEISYEDIGIYPLKKSSEAWEDFLKGNGYIANAGNSTFTKRVVIRDAYLAYYDNSEEQSYLQPVYVFIGDNGFIGYAQALSSEFVSQ